MSKTLEQVVLALPCDGATTLAIIGALKEAGLADATVYGLCETCGGSGKCPACWHDGVTVSEFRDGTAIAGECRVCKGTGECPDCTAVSVVAKELRERAIEEAGRAATLNSIEAHCMAREPLEDVVDAVLSTVLGKTRAARQILFVESTSAPYAMAGDTIAILEDDDE
jgi:hypothetical protein